MTNTTKKFKNTAVAITTGLLAATMSACSFGSKPASVSTPGGGMTPEASVSPSASATPSATPKPTPSPEASESGKNESSSSAAVGAPKVSSKGKGAKTYNTSVRSGYTQEDPFAEQKNACSATWGTWIDGTGCTWPSYGGSTAAKNTKSSDPVIDELTLLRNNVEKATKALASAVATRDNASANVESAKAALKEAQSTLLTSKETLESRKMALAQAESLLSVSETNLNLHRHSAEL